MGSGQMHRRLADSLRDPVLAISVGLTVLCLLLGAAAVVSPTARGFYEAGFAAMYEAMAGMAAACQWTY